MSQEIPGVYIISDSIGETAELAVKAAASQFDSGNVEIRRIPNVSSPAILDEAVAKARRDNFVIVYTLVLPELLAHMHQTRLARISCTMPISELSREIGRASCRERV